MHPRHGTRIAANTTSALGAGRPGRWKTRRKRRSWIACLFINFVELPNVVSTLNLEAQRYSINTIGENSFIGSRPDNLLFAYSHGGGGKCRGWVRCDAGAVEVGGWFCFALLQCALWFSYALLLCACALLLTSEKGCGGGGCAIVKKLFVNEIIIIMYKSSIIRSINTSQKA